MNYHVLTMTLKFTERDGVYSILSNNDGSLLLWIMEREWRHNQRNVSCVPRDEYILEPHSGAKYKETYALVGDGVGHLQAEGKPRFACVLHRAVFPLELEGCLCPAKSIAPIGHTVGSAEAITELLAYLDRHTNEGQRVKLLMQGAFS